MSNFASSDNRTEKLNELLIDAVSHGLMEMTTYLLEKGADDINSALEVAVKEKQTKIPKTII